MKYKTSSNIKGYGKELNHSLPVEHLGQCFIHDKYEEILPKLLRYYHIQRLFCLQLYIYKK